MRDWIIQYTQDANTMEMAVADIIIGINHTMGTNPSG